MIKKRKLSGLAAIVTAIVFIAFSVGVTSCSGPEGPIGPEGPQGPAGSSGADGSDGSSGQDGQDGSDGRPATYVVPCTVTFDTGEEGTKVDPQELIKGGKANRPGSAFRPFTQEQMYAEGAGLYKVSTDNGWILLGWKMQDDSYYDFDKAVTSDIHLTADWAMPGKIDTGSDGIDAVPTNADFFDKALEYVIKEPASYYLVIDDDYTAESTKIATMTGISLTIVGLENERTITSGTGTTGGTLFDINNGAQLHLENNITLKGKSTASTSSLINITNGSLTMNDGSIITGYTTSAALVGAIDINGVTARFVMNGGQISGNQNTNTAKDAGIVIIRNSGLFTMNSGTITGNTVAAAGCINTNEGTLTMYGGTITENSNTNTGAYPGGVYIQNITRNGLAMYGGSITGNTGGKMGDVYRAGINTTAASANKDIIIFYEGDGHIGILTTVHHTGTVADATAAQIKIAGRWTGSVQTLNLFYDFADFSIVNSFFNNKFLVAKFGSYTLTSADIDNFKQVNFMRTDFQTQSIANTVYVLVRSGANIGKIN
jgi:hypothetical protein